MRSLLLVLLLTLSHSTWISAQDLAQPPTAQPPTAQPPTAQPPTAEPSANHTPTTPLCDQLETIVEHVLAHHYAPPTRQQMVLAILGDTLPADTTLTPAQLSIRISDIGSRVELYGYMREQIGHLQTASVKQLIEQSQLENLRRTIPGSFDVLRAKDAGVEEQLAANRYIGIGVALMNENDKFVFGQIIPDGAASSAGIVAQDLLLAVNDQSVTGQKLETVIDWLRGPEGSQLSVSVQSGAEPPRELMLTRRLVPMKTLKQGDVSSDKQLFIRVTDLKASTIGELEELLEQQPDSVESIELMLPATQNVHLAHLLIDALADEALLGELVTRGATSQLRTVNGHILGQRRLTVRFDSTQPFSSLVLYHFARRAGLKLQELTQELEDLPAQTTVGINYEHFPMGDGVHVVKIATSAVVTGE